MIKEVAIDPELLRDPEKAIPLAHQVGFHHARVLISLPEKVWGQLHRDSKARCAGLKWRRTQAYLVALKKLHLGAIKRAGVGPRGDSEWVEFAATEHRREALHAILSGSGREGAPVVDYESIYDGDSPWHAETSFEVRSTKRSILRAVRLLLHRTEEVHIVDPYLDGTGDYVEPLKAILQQMKVSGGTRLIWHASERVYREAGWGVAKWRENTEASLRYDLEDLLGSELTFGLVLHDPKMLHDRFLLTARGGISFGTGFAARGQHKPPINAFVLSPDKAKRELERFRSLSNGNIVFSVGGPASLRL